MSSPYAVLGNKPLDQWKVTELKEELKRRKLTTRGLKEDLVKRLDEAVRSELESFKEKADDGLSNCVQSDLHSEVAEHESKFSGKTKDLVDVEINFIGNVDGSAGSEVLDYRESLSTDKVVVGELAERTNNAGLEGQLDSHYTAVGTTVVPLETVETVTALSGSYEIGDSNSRLNKVGLKPTQEDLTSGLYNAKTKLPLGDDKIENLDPGAQVHEISESTMSVIPSSEPGLQVSETRTQSTESMVQHENDESQCVQPDHTVQSLDNGVSKVGSDLGFQVISHSASTESISINEKNEIKVDAFTDDVKLDLEVRNEMVQQSSNILVPDGGESHPMDVKEPLVQKVSVELNSENSAENTGSPEKIAVGDVDPAEKLSLDRSSGDDSVEEDAWENKLVDEKSDSVELKEKAVKPETPAVQEENDVDVIGDVEPVDNKFAIAENEVSPAFENVKRKSYEAVGNNETGKRQRRWNVEGPKASDQLNVNVLDSAPLEDSSHPTFKRFSRLNSIENEAAPKERLVPPSPRPPTNSLRIDRFLRPFTLKAVQDLLGKTGTVTSFWMDHIKTHCYISYSSVEEAIDTRNAVYNLQWPPNGGRLLVAEFVDPQEVKSRVEAPPFLEKSSSSAAPAFSTAQSPTTIQPQQPLPHQQVQRQQVPAPSLPTPPLSNPPLMRDRIKLPPPPPLPEKVEPPIVTLDDLFKKTKATPRIYYLPLSDEQVAVKLKAAHGKNVNQ